MNTIQRKYNVVGTPLRSNRRVDGVVPEWVKELLSDCPTPHKMLDRKTLVKMCGTWKRSVAEPIIIQKLTEKIKQDTIILYGLQHPQAHPDYVWTPLKRKN